MRNTPFVAPVKIVTFHNYLPIQFTFYWDKVPYVLEPGEKMRMEDWKAKHAAVHLADQWCYLNKKDNRHAEQFFIDKMNEAIIEEGSSTATSSGEISRQATAMLNEQAPTPVIDESPKVRIVQKKITCTDCGSTGPRHKKTCVKLNKDAVAA